MHALDTDYFFTTPLYGPSIFFHLLTAGWVILFLVSAFAYWRRGKLAPENPVLRRFIRSTATAGMWFAGVGLFLAAMRYAQIPYFGMRIWMYLLFVAIIGTVAYYVYEWSERYPLEMWNLQQSHVERRYRPVAKGRPEPQRARPNPRVRGKRRR